MAPLCSVDVNEKQHSSTRPTLSLPPISTRNRNDSLPLSILVLLSSPSLPQLSDLCIFSDLNFQAKKQKGPWISIARTIHFVLLLSVSFLAPTRSFFPETDLGSVILQRQRRRLLRLLWPHFGDSFPAAENLKR
ncbi:hypothetical protein Dimus_020686 [Dionaea muscipula]